MHCDLADTDNVILQFIHNRFKRNVESCINPVTIHIIKAAHPIKNAKMNAVTNKELHIHRIKI
jgi:hypothetical protein